MDTTSLVQIQSFWPDVASPFDEIVPSGLRLRAAEDEWWGGDAHRRRRIELDREPGAPPIADLLEEAGHDAFRIGWSPHGDGTHELEDVVLSLANRDDRLHVEFLQRWPSDHGPPVETSEMFQNLVRRLLQIGTDPVRLMKRIEVNAERLMIADVLDERVELPHHDGVLEKLDELGFRVRSKGLWISKELTATHQIKAWLEDTGPHVRVRMQRSRIGSP